MSRSRILRVLTGLLIVVGGTAFSVREAEPAAADTSFTFHGGGFGHGVGMSQYGARGQALAGRSAAEIAAFYYPGTAVRPVTEPNDLRIRIATTTGTTVASTSDAGTGQLAVLVDGVLIGRSARGEAVTISGDATHVAVRIGGQPARVGSWAAVEYVQSASVMRVAASGYRYDRGVLEVTPTGTGSVQLNIRRLTMSEYLYGLGEVPSSWPAAALEVQSITGRSYAIVRTARRRATGASYDVDASVLDQAYIGYEKAASGSFAAWKGAVDVTAGSVVMTSTGQVAEALYSSSTGGHSENNEYVFNGTPVSYLRAVPDPFEASSGNPYHRWTRSFTGAELGTWFVGSGAVVTEVRFAGPFGASGRINQANVTLVSSGGTRTVKGDAFRTTINARVGFDRELLSTLLILQPVGSLDGVVPTTEGLLATGWAWDPTNNGSTPVDIYVDGVLRLRGLANQPRPDVGLAVPGAGSNRGFALAVASSPGQHQVCAYAIDDGNAANTLLGCRSVTVGSTPIGNLDGVRRIPGGVELLGWAIDRSSGTAPILVHGYVDGRWAGQVVADRPRSDVAAVYPAYGPSHGFQLPLGVGDGRHQVCVYAIDDEGFNPLLGCAEVTVTGDATGNLEAVRRPNPLDPYTVEVIGWALDFDTAASVGVHAYLRDPYPNGSFAGAGTASLNRPDVALAYPGYGEAHGFSVVTPYPPGRHRVCVHALNAAGPGANGLLGCANPPDAAPFGDVNSIERSAPSELRILGWGLDPDTTGPVAVHVYLGGPAGSGQFGGSFTATALRADVGAAYPGFGDLHGIDVRVPAPAQPTSVYVYLIDVGGSQNPLIGSAASR